MEKLTGKKLNKLWNIGARQCLYRQNGKWYHPLTKFPAALCDQEGYLFFENEFEYKSCLGLKITEKSIHIGGNGISDIPEYINVVEQSQNISWWQRLIKMFKGALTNEK